MPTRRPAASAKLDSRSYMPSSSGLQKPTFPEPTFSDPSRCSNEPHSRHSRRWVRHQVFHIVNKNHLFYYTSNSMFYTPNGDIVIALSWKPPSKSGMRRGGDQLKIFILEKGNLKNILNKTIFWTKRVKDVLGD